MIATCVDGHRVQPGRRVVLDVETADVTPDLEEDVLRDVLGRVRAIAGPSLELSGPELESGPVVSAGGPGKAPRFVR